MSKCTIHFIKDDALFLKQYLNHVPSLGDEIRIGDENNEKYYVVTQIVWVYDEPGHPFERVNVGIEPV